MTGFGRATFSTDLLDASIDISSVNRKGLEIGCNFPREWANVEQNAVARVKEFYTRGKVSVAIKANFKNGKASAFGNSEALKEALANLKSFCDTQNLPFAPNLSDIISVAKNLELSQQLPDFELIKTAFDNAFLSALRDADNMRKIEGQNLKTDFLSRLETLKTFLSTIENESKKTVVNFRDILLARLKNLDLAIDLNDERVLKEISIFADKCDICEEITRLKSHLGQFLNCLNSDENCGRKLDFICQEIGREINTIGSKSNSLNITKVVIDFKNELERIREQVQNVE